MARALVASVLLVLFSPAVAGGFLQLANITTDELESSLLSELAQAVSSNGAGHERIESLQVQLKPMYEAVPKESDGTISHAVVRYVLHRFFAKNLGWFVRGLEPRGTQNETQQGLEDMKEWIPDYMQNFMEKVLGGKGLSLRELAIFAATLEDFVHKEEHEWLKQVYSLLWHRLDSELTKEETQELLETYLMVYNLDGDFTVPTATKVRHVLARFAAKVTGWEDTKAWFTKLIDDMWGKDEERTINFDEASGIVKNVGEKYGEFNDLQCLKMKKELISVESRKPGRVKLTDFYKKSLYGTWEFNEKIDYLRSLGTLDESDPSTPLVIVPNYVASRPQCLISSNYYALCCRNECEDLLGSLEGNIKAPEADPSEIAKLVSALPSSTVQAPRVLPTSLLSRLDDVATLNGGKVPLHGRLFAQWLHHAFPRECPFPHVGNETNPQSADEWMKETGEKDSKATEEEMLARVRKDSCKLTPVGVECEKKRPLLSHHSNKTHDEEVPELPWNQVEELLVVRPTAVTSPPSSLSRNYMRDLVLYIALSASMSVMGCMFRDTLAAWVPLPMSKKTDRCMI